MDKNAIKKYAVWARRELISRVSQRAERYGITEKDTGDVNATSVNGHVLSETERKQRQALIGQIHAKNYEQVMEEVAYTWFNRFSALRFMEVNGYLPSHVRVFTDDENNFKPQIMTEAINLEIDGIDMEKVYALKNANDDDELFKYLIITQCNALSNILPGMFQKIDDYTELLFPDNLLRDGSAVEQMVAMIPQEDWQDAVQIIGWLYQYYNSEKKDEVFAALKKNVKITKENIPAATQLFTPDWIVRYMVENSLGRLWVEGHPNEELKSQWKYYLEEAEQEPEVQVKLSEIRKEYAALNPEDIRCIDPCSGSGHICVYMFDVLMQIYESYGYTVKEAVISIVEKNIYGLDIDERAAQLAYFAVMMKARQYDRRFFSRGVQPHMYAIQESNELDSYAVEYFCNGDANLKKAMKTLMDEMRDAKEYGSVLNVSQVDFVTLHIRLDEIKNDISIHREVALNQLIPFINCAEAMAQKYHVVITNPPYMGSSGMDSSLSKYIKEYYPNEKSDMFSCFISKNKSFSLQNGFVSMITMESWMFLSSFESLRNQILNSMSIECLTHMPYLGKGGTSLGINFGTAMFILRKTSGIDFLGAYNCVTHLDTDDNGIPYEFPVKNSRNKVQRQSNYLLIPSAPIGYWLSYQSFENFRNMGTIGEYISPRIGLITGDNNRFLRLWHEVSWDNTGFGIKSIQDSIDSKKKWFPYQKGGDFRKWYGNFDYVVDWQDDGYLMKNDNYDKGRVRSHNYNGDYSFISCITWTSVTTGNFACRFAPEGFLFDAAGPICRVNNPEDIFLFLGILSSNVGRYYLSVINPTINFHPGYIMAIPFSMEAILPFKEEIVSLVKENIAICKEEYDDYEHSWNFKRHPLCKFGSKYIKEAFDKWQEYSIVRRKRLSDNERKLNEFIITAYKLEGEVLPEVSDELVSLRVADVHSDIVSFISYAVGCMFGRYSIERDGIAYAGGEWKIDNSCRFVPDKDNIIPICDDEYFEDDIVGRFIEFVSITFGADELEENLRFIADVLGGKGQSRDILRNYFINNFYSDHCSQYSTTGSGKRPIYWLFDSGKKNGFKALIYMHRYQPDTIARIRTDYVHEQQSRYRTAIADLEQRAATASTSERVKLNKRLKALKDQATEIQGYEEKIHHLADQFISIDLDDGVKKNYEIFKDVLAKIK